MKIVLIGLLLVGSNAVSFSQIAVTSDLFKTLKTEDSLLFNVGFNTCDISQFENLVSDNFEFYHDEAGPTLSKSDFIAGIRDGLCKLPYKARRELVENSLEVYPLEKKGVLYGAIQNGRHRFYALEKDKPEYLTSTARFTHLWLLENGRWRLHRALSYDHHNPK
ncbi:MAG: nuclear transport factor 2 family protein [Bacteroidota bacterium]|nr:nuclear transport factor 2 family protein [Bacteroidota bacterium]MDP4231614.1 nuclear transport factor 2 family protein [Bacteroidota bacterium]